MTPSRCFVTQFFTVVGICCFGTHSTCIIDIRQLAIKCDTESKVMNRSSTFENIPSELLQRIFGILRPSLRQTDFERALSCKDLQDLRSTCRVFANAAAVPLFREIHIWLEKDSLQDFIRYSEHPLIGKCIRRVIVGGERLDPYVFWGESSPPHRCVHQTKGFSEVIEQLHSLANWYVTTTLFNPHSPGF